MRRELAIGIGLALAGLASSARAAETHPAVVLTLGTCAGVDPGELRRILPIELDAPLADAHDAGAMDVSVQCEGERAHVRVAGARAPLERTIDLSTTRDVGRARYVAIAIAELVSAPDVVAPIATPAPVTPPLSPTLPPVIDPAEALSVPLPPSDAHWTVGGFVGYRLFFSTGLISSGGGAFLRHPLTRHLELTLDAGGEHGSLAENLGTIDVTTVAMGGIVSVHRTHRWLTIRWGGGLRGGFGSVWGVPLEAPVLHHGSFLAAWGGPVAESDLEALIASTITVGVHSDLGYDLIPSHALINGSRVGSQVGVWLGTRVYLGIRF